MNPFPKGTIDILAAPLCGAVRVLTTFQSKMRVLRYVGFRYRSGLGSGGICCGAARFGALLSNHQVKFTSALYKTWHITDGQMGTHRHLPLPSPTLPTHAASSHLPHQIGSGWPNARLPSPAPADALVEEENKQAARVLVAKAASTHRHYSAQTLFASFTKVFCGQE